MNGHGEQFLIRQLSRLPFCSSLFPGEQILRDLVSCIDSDHLQRKNPNRAWLAIHVRLTLLEGGARQFHPSAEQISPGIIYFEEIGRNTVGRGIVEGFVLQVVDGLVAYKPHARVKDHIIGDPAVLMDMLGVVGNYPQRVGPMRPPHTTLCSALEDPGQFCIGDRIAGRQSVLERQCIPPWQFSRWNGSWCIIERFQ